MCYQQDATQNASAATAASLGWPGATLSNGPNDHLRLQTKIVHE